jgi:hypothetical protein
MRKYGRARQATDDNITRRMRFACWVTKATDTHSQYISLIIINSNTKYFVARQQYKGKHLFAFSWQQ